VNLLRKHLTVANVLSCIALFVALSGAAYAATTAGKNSVKASSIAKGAVTTPKLRNGAVTGAKLRNGAVTTAKIAPAAVGASQIGNGAVRSEALGGGVVTSAKLKKGAVTSETIAGNAVGLSQLGPNSVATAKIQDGAVSSSKLASTLLASLVKNVLYVTASSLSNTSEGTKTVTASCPTGRQVVGGGAKLVGGDKPNVITASTPTAAGSEGKRTGWTAVATQPELNGVNWSVEATAICGEF
jgi:hypothetical protein